MLGPWIKANWRWSNRRWMARVNINIVGISELKWARMGEFNSDDHYIYYCGQEYLRRNGVAIIVNKRVWNALQFNSVQSLSRVRLFVTPWIAARQASLSITNSWSSLKLMSIELVMPSSHLILCRSLLLLPSIFPSIRVFSNELFPSGGQNIGASASASVLPVNIQDWFPLGLPGLISVQPKGFSRVFSNTTVQKHQLFSVGLLYGPTLISTQDYWKSHGFDYTDLCQQSSISAF